MKKCLYTLLTATIISAQIVVAQSSFVLDTVVDVPNSQSGKCYARYLHADSSWLGHFSMQFIPQKEEMVRIAVYPAYFYYALRENAKIAYSEKDDIVTIEPPKYEIVNNQRLLKVAEMYWTQRAKPSPCLKTPHAFTFVVCFTESPSIYEKYTFFALREPAKIKHQRPDTTWIEALDSTSPLLVKVEVPPQYATFMRLVNNSDAHYRIESDRDFKDVLADWQEVECTGCFPIVTTLMIQKALNKNGYYLKEDDIMGKATKKAMTDFREKKGLPVTNFNMELMEALGVNLFFRN